MRKLIVLVMIFLSIIMVNVVSTAPYFSPNTNLENTYAIQSTSTPSPSAFDPIFLSQAIPNHIYENMLGNSIPFEYKDTVNISSLSYLQVSYFGFDNKPHTGEIIVNSKLSSDVLEIFKELYDIQYPIEKIKLIDEYSANDELSMSDNNSSCFCFRTIAGKSSLSNHAMRQSN